MRPEWSCTPVRPLKRNGRYLCCFPLARVSALLPRCREPSAARGGWRGGAAPDCSAAAVLDWIRKGRAGRQFGLRRRGAFVKHVLGASGGRHMVLQQGLMGGRVAFVGGPRRAPVARTPFMRNWECLNARCRRCRGQQTFTGIKMDVPFMRHLGAPCWTADNGDCAAQWFTVRAPYRFPRFRPQQGRALATTRPRDGMGSARQREGGGISSRCRPTLADCDAVFIYLLKSRNWSETSSRRPVEAKFLFCRRQLVLPPFFWVFF